MEIFKILGTIALNGVDEANKNIDGMTSHAENSQSRITSAFKKIGAAVVTYFAVDKIKDFGQACVDATAEISAEQSAFEQIMGDSGADNRIENFREGEFVVVNSEAHNMKNRKFLVTNVTLDLSDPSKSQIAFGSGSDYITSQISGSVNYNGNVKITDTTGSTGSFEPLGSASAALNAAKNYTDNSLAEKVDKIEGKVLSSNDYTDGEKNKLAGIEPGANKTIVDSALSTTSLNPVQNKAVTQKLNAADSVIAGLSNSMRNAFNSINNKVDKVEGKDLSTNDFTDGWKTAIEFNQNEISKLKSNKVDKVEGKGLSTNDFTNEYKRQIDFNKASAEYLAAHKADVTDVNGVKADISEINEALGGHTLGKNVPANADFSDTKVGQYSSDYNADFRLLLSNSANQTSETASTNKSSRFTANPATGELKAVKFTGDFNGALTGTLDGHSLGKNVPANAIFTDECVRQQNTGFNRDFRILMSYSDDDSPEIKSVYKSGKFTANPYTGELTAEKFTGNFSGTIGGSGLVAKFANGTNNSKNTYVKIARIEITGSNMDLPILIVYAGREYEFPVFLSVRFNNVSNADPGLATFKYFGCGKGANAYIYKSAAGTWDVYVQKLAAYDGIAVLWYSVPEKTTKLAALTLTNESLSAAVSGWTQATKITL